MRWYVHELFIDCASGTAVVMLLIVLCCALSVRSRWMSPRLTATPHTSRSIL